MIIISIYYIPTTNLPTYQATNYPEFWVNCTKWKWSFIISLSVCRSKFQFTYWGPNVFIVCIRFLCSFIRSFVFNVDFAIYHFVFDFIPGAKAKWFVFLAIHSIARQNKVNQNNVRKLRNVTFTNTFVRVHRI